MKSLQWLQNVGCLKKRGTNLWPLTSWTFFCRRAPRRCTPNPPAPGFDTASTTSALSAWLLMTLCFSTLSPAALSSAIFLGTQSWWLRQPLTTTTTTRWLLLPLLQLLTTATDWVWSAKSSLCARRRVMWSLHWPALCRAVKLSRLAPQTMPTTGVQPIR